MTEEQRRIENETEEKEELEEPDQENGSWYMK